MPRILTFLGYNPLPPPKTLMEKLDQFRHLRGWSIPMLGEDIGLTPDSIAGWLRGEHRPGQTQRKRIEAYLAEQLLCPLDETS